MPAGSRQFRTFQNPQAYEEALARHGQHLRWTRGQICPCLNPNTGQADPSCSLCNGRGVIYRTPGIMSVLQEAMKHDSYGVVTPTYAPVVGTPRITKKGVVLILAGSQPGDGSYIQLDPPYPKAWEKLYGNYDFSPVLSVTNENSTVLSATAKTLKTIAPLFWEKGKQFEGSIDEVTRVYNVDKTETYTVTEALKEYIYLSAMGTWGSGDVLQVDYSYVRPFEFILLGISQRMRYESAYVMEEADAVLITPYWARIAASDLLTALASEQNSSVVIDPTLGAGNDEIRGYFDVSRLIHVMDKSSNEYTIGTDLELYGRNEIKWLVTKPTVRYSVSFLYHPSFSALQSLPTLRSAENKSFVNRVSLKLYDRTSSEFTI